LKCVRWCICLGPTYLDAASIMKEADVWIETLKAVLMQLSLDLDRFELPSFLCEFSWLWLHSQVFQIFWALM
jgi:hypothetical protein